MDKERSQFPVMPGIETDLALQRLGGNSPLLRKLMGKFVINHHKSKEEIIAALAQEDRESACRLAHTLKGVAGTIGALALETKAGLVSNALKRGDDVSELLDEMDETLQNVLISLAQLK
jgi:two-component system, sensor histidine kinase and response regulator